MLPKSLLFFILLLLAAANAEAQTLWSFHDTTTNLYGFKDKAGLVVIPAQYAMAFSEKLQHYAAVATDKYIIAINAEGRELYRIVNFDNGPDYASEGLFRIVGKDHKIGFANAKTGAIVIEPKYVRALPFEKGRAMVSDEEGESLKDGNWYYINKKGKRLPSSKHP